MERLIKWAVSLLPKAIQDIYYKYEEKWLYLIFGALTTLVSIVTKLLIFYLVPGNPWWENTCGVIVSWVCAVTFAFFTNKKYVFKNETKTRSEFWRVFVSFFGARGATLIMEWLIFFVCCDIMNISQKLMTFVSQVVIFIANYLLSKLFVFKNKKEGT